MKVWIELERPADEAQGIEYAEKYNAMLKKLGIKSIEFYWSEPDREWWKAYTSGAGYVTMVDNGEWFDMSKIIKDKATA